MILPAATLLVFVASTGGGDASQFDDAPYRVFWGVGDNSWLTDPVNGGEPGGSGLAYPVSKWGITAFNRTGLGSAGGMAFNW